ncbi:MAG: succinate dehydrogenase [Candidatus Bathyarchaeia archaeon]
METVVWWSLLAFSAPSLIPVREVFGYLSPLYSPSEFALWIPLGFRLTCYYYRKFYYRKVFLHPFSCGRTEPHRGSYTGETKLPFVVSNLHRYFLYLSIMVVAFLFYDAVNGMFLSEAFNFRLGSALLWLNALLLALYTFSCHSFRHLVGGGVDCFTCSRAGMQRKSIWGAISRINKHHMLWAWMSLIVVLYVPFHISMIAWGWIPDPRLM